MGLLLVLQGLYEMFLHNLQLLDNFSSRFPIGPPQIIVTVSGVALCTLRQ